MATELESHIEDSPHLQDDLVKYSLGVNVLRIELQDFTIRRDIDHSFDLSSFVLCQSRC